ncbi:MAG: isocitrate/isopropylmalate dehydrogenase family protein [Candidatus Hydrothermarchaeota archaeon]
MYKVGIIHGDGIGPEVVSACLNVLEKIPVKFEFISVDAGYEYWKKHNSNSLVPDETMEILKETDALLKGPTTTPQGPDSPKSVAVTIRQEFQLYANVRPFKKREGVSAPVDKLDVILVRENTEGLYKGLEFKLNEDTAIGIRTITKKGSERISRFAFELARKEKRKKVTAVHKANICKETCGLFLNICKEVSKEYPDIEFDDSHVDATAMWLIRRPEWYDVLVTTNLFGDILSDELAALTGSIGLSPGANIGDDYAMFEPVHGSAPKYKGQNKVNPSATILSGAMMLKYLGEEKYSKIIEKAVEDIIKESKTVTYDLGGKAKTSEMSDAIAKKVEDYIKIQE